MVHGLTGAGADSCAVHVQGVVTVPDCNSGESEGLLASVVVSANGGQCCSLLPATDLIARLHQDFVHGLNGQKGECYWLSLACCLATCPARYDMSGIKSGSGCTFESTAFVQ